MSTTTLPHDAAVGPARQRARKLTPSDARSHNRSLVLQKLFLTDGFSRAELARSTGLTAATMSRIIGDLIDDGYVRELTERAPGSVGRPAVTVALDTDRHKVVAIDLSAADNRIRGAIATLTGELRGHRELADQGGTPEEFVEHLAGFCEQLIRDAEVDVIGVGIAAPGLVDANGTVLLAMMRGWVDFRLAAVLSHRLGIPVHVGNDAYSSMQAELTLGHADQHGSFFVTIGVGVGSGAVIDGAVVRGAEHAPGEIGHVRIVDEGGLLCACGNHGCLETVLAAASLRRAIAASDAPTALRAAGRVLGKALAPIVSALNLVDIVLGGPEDLVTDDLKHEVLAAIRERTLPALSDHLIVRSSSLGDDVALAGAAVLVVSGELGVS